MSFEIFGRSRKNLPKIYEILKSCIEAPLSQSSISRYARVARSAELDLVIVQHLVSEGLLNTVTPEEYMKLGLYRQSRRNPSKIIPVYYQTSKLGLRVVREFEKLLIRVGLEEHMKRRWRY